jgi:hypothetical protein
MSIASSLLALGLIAAAPLESAERPTQTGDPIGTVTMQPDGSLVMQLRSVQCDGVTAETRMTVAATEPLYKTVLMHVGGLKPSETKVVLAWPTEPCPKTNLVILGVGALTLNKRARHRTRLFIETSFGASAFDATAFC